MFFNLFRKKDASPLLVDVTYIHQKAKAEAIVRKAKNDAGIIFIPWFSATAALYKALFQEAGLPDSRIMEARYFHSAKVAGHAIVFLEHYPLRSKEIALIKDLPLEGVRVYNSLDEPLFTFFGGNRIIDLVKKMGMKEDEELEHLLITSSIARAQEKIEKKVGMEIPAQSQEEWMEKNVR
jgi:uncharacterized protein YbaP (TraB family)